MSDFLPAHGLAPGGDAAGLKGLRVLFVAGNDRSNAVDALLACAGSDVGWAVEMLHADPARFCERQPWEADHAQVAELDALIRDCELASGVSAGRILLAGERDLGRGFSGLHFHAAQNAISRSVAGDNDEPFRILRRMFAFARDTLQRIRPDLVAAAGWGEPLCFVFHMVARRQDIACAALRPSQIWSGRGYWSDTLASFNTRAGALAGEKRAANEFVNADTQNHIAAFRTGAAGSEPFHSNTFRQWRQARFFHRFDAETLAGLRYIYIALHEDPSEALNLQAPFWANQYNTAALLTGSLPAGYKLLVHEHRDNAGRRPRQYYDDLSRLPGLVLVDGSEPRFNYVANAALVVTENGPAGWEGLLLGRPVITLADNFYQGAGLAHRLRNPEHLSATVADQLAPTLQRDGTDHERSLGWMLDAERETTAPMQDSTAIMHLLAEFLDQRTEAASTRFARMEAVS